MRKIWNSLSVRILTAVIAGMVIATIILTNVIVQMSEDIFVETYGEAQDKVFSQVEKNLNDYYERISAAMNELDESRSFRYLFYETDKKTEEQSLKRFNELYQFKRDAETTIEKYISSQKFLVVGRNGETYTNHSEAITTSVEDILEDDITKSVQQHPETVHFYYRKGGFSQSTKDLDVIIAVKAFIRKNESQPFAYAYVTLTETDVCQFYDFYVTSTNDFFMLDSDKRVIATSCTEKNGTFVQDAWMEVSGLDNMQICKTDDASVTVFYRELPYYDFEIYGLIDNRKALGQLYETDRILYYCIMLVLLVVVIVGCIVNHAVKPLQIMVEKMQKIKDGDFEEYMEPKGSNEIVELANTYNYMLDDLKSYVDKLMQTQREKRKAEIHALQMQINPHYIYNTLASIKWLIFQGDVNKATRTIDSFIFLLRSTISDTKEFITVKQEVENLENYVQIQQTRYGDQIKTEFFVLQECAGDLLPKMILQPFVENAFFHAFPSGQQGKIQVFFKERDNQLEVVVQDDGVGMTQEEVKGIAKKKHEKFSGIGVRNIRERLSLLYGEQAELKIESRKDEGTTVTIHIPIER